MSRAAQNQYQTDQATINAQQGVQTQAAKNVAAQASQIKDLSPADEAAQTAQVGSGTAATFGQGMIRAKDQAARSGSGPAALGAVNANLTRGQAQQHATDTQNLNTNFRNVNNQAAQERAGVFSQGAQIGQGQLNAETQQQGALAQSAYAPGLFSQIMGGLAGGAGAAATTIGLKKL